MIRRPLSRRTLLRGAGGVALALPWLEAMEARGATAPPKRFIFFYNPDGTAMDEYTPTGSETSFTFKRILAPLTPLKSKLLLISNLDITAGAAGGHRAPMGALLTGRKPISNTNGSGPSLDQYLGAELAKRSPVKFPSLQLGVQVDLSEDLRSYLSYSAPGVPVAAENSPTAAFSRIFAGVTGAPTMADPAVARRRSILGRLKVQLTSLQPKVSSADWVKLDEHFTALDEIEKSLAISVPTGCTPPSATPGTAFDQNARAQMNILVRALSCGLSNVGVLQYSKSVSLINFGFAMIPGVSHHGLTHTGGTAAHESHIRIMEWYGNQFATLLNLMASIPEGGGTMLDNSVVLWSTIFSDPNSHNPRNIPFVLAGGGGAFRTGRWLQLPSPQPHNRALLSIIQAMGVNASTFGEPALCAGGPLPLS